ncbi:MAG: TetR/AcrR family transcriptional regulator [bacterium]|nr:TetR/AcrR family transcriptional regulator [bacterium]
MAMNKGEETKKRVIDTAISLINTQGFANTSMNDLIERTGVKKGNLYFHFKSKDDLGIEILKEAKKQYNAYIEQRVKSSTPLGQLFDILEAIKAWHVRKKFRGGCLFGNTALEMSDTNETYTKIISQIFTEWLDTFEYFLVKAKEEKEISSSIDTKAMATHILSLIEGSIMLARVSKSKAPIENSINSLKSLLMNKE